MMSEDRIDSETPARAAGADAPRRRPRIVLLAFLISFAAARIVVFLIMDRRMPDLFLHIGGTHVHHLNYGIFLLAGVAGHLLFARPGKRATDGIAVLYGIGLALTFDEFGMWIHLGGGYWQRASFDAVCVVAAILGLLAFAPPPRSWRPKHWAAGVVAIAVSGVFFVLLARTLRHAGEWLEPKLDRLEQRGPA